MHRHDLDLIAAYASGHLDDEVRARELVASCDQCRSEYQLHLSIQSELGDLDRQKMTETERSAMHRDLWTDLRASSRATSRSGAARTPWWYRWSAAAAGLFLVAGLLTVLANQNPSDEFETIGNDLTTGESPRLGDNAPEESDDASTDTTARGVAPPGPVSQPGSMGSDGSGEVQEYLEMIERARASEAAELGGYTSQDAADQTAACLREAGLEGQRTIGEVDTDTPYLLAVPSDEPFEPDSRITVVDTATCEIVHVDLPPNPQE